MLFHVSEEEGIERFEPRWSESAGQDVVWAIDADHLRNYLLPRECPRVTYYAGPQTVNTDVEQFLGILENFDARGRNRHPADEVAGAFINALEGIGRKLVAEQPRNAQSRIANE